MFGFLVLFFTFTICACSNDSSTEQAAPKVVWEYESFVCEAYDAQGGNPYICDGVNTSQYPLGELITRDQMGAELLLLFSFADDGYLYSFYNSPYISNNSWEKVSTYKVQGDYLILDSDYSVFFPSGQTAPKAFEATEVTHEILAWTDSLLSIRQIQTDSHTGTRLIFTENFRRHND